MTKGAASVTGSRSQLVKKAVLAVMVKAAFARRRAIDPCAQSRRGHSRATSPRWGVRHRRKWRVNVNAHYLHFPPGPLCSLGIGTAAALQGGSAYRGLLEYPYVTEASLCRVAALFLFDFRCSREPRSHFFDILRGCCKPMRHPLMLLSKLFPVQLKRSMTQV